jgi:hypothetical protein
MRAGAASVKAEREDRNHDGPYPLTTSFDAVLIYAIAIQEKEGLELQQRNAAATM